MLGSIFYEITTLSSEILTIIFKFRVFIFIFSIRTTCIYFGLLKYPKLIDAFILAREKAGRNGNPIDWLITSDKKDYFDDKPYYICRWLNHSFMPFTKKQEEFYRKVREKYDQLKSNKSNKK